MFRDGLVGVVVFGWGEGFGGGGGMGRITACHAAFASARCTRFEAWGVE